MKKILNIILIVIIIVFIGYLCGVKFINNNLPHKKLYKIYSKDESFNCDFSKDCKKEEIIQIDENNSFSLTRKLYYKNALYDFTISNEIINFNGDYSFYDNKVTFIYNNGKNRYFGTYYLENEKIELDFLYNVNDESLNDYFYAKEEALIFCKYIINLIEKDLEKLK